MRVEPYKLHTNEELKEILLRSLSRIKCDLEFKKHWSDLIVEAFESEYWNPVKDFNGCTIVQDERHPSPSCFVHDYMWITGHGGVMSDRIFKACMYAQGMKRSKANIRWFLVRVGWIFGFYWKYISKRTLKKPTDTMKRFDNFITNK